MKIKRFISLLVFAILICGFQPEKKQAYDIALELVAENLVSPVAMECPNDGTNRKFVVEQRGLIYIIDANGKLQNIPFLDISKKIEKLMGGYDERGLLGLAFHPNFKENRRFFIYYSAPAQTNSSNHIAILAEYKAESSDPNKANLAERIILRIPQPEWNHNGGQLLFDLHGKLLLGLGDGGSGGDPHGAHGNGQNLNSLLGKIIRIDVDGKQPYSVPQDNPFVGKDGADEIYAYGLRNPWRFSIDKVSGRLFCGDVGQDKYEEVDIIEKGGNYGWRIMEGYHVFSESEKATANSNLEKPIDEYDHDLGVSVTGGYVYRGKKIKQFMGQYIFGDWNGILFSLAEQKDKTWKRKQLKVDYPNFKSLKINSFGQDTDGEIYILVQKATGPFRTSGKIFKLIE